MPLYDLICPECGELLIDAKVKYEDIKQGIPCAWCNKHLVIKVSAVSHS